jgi:hypothetical protein
MLNIPLRRVVLLTAAYLAALAAIFSVAIAAPQVDVGNARLFVEVKTTTPYPLTATVLGSASGATIRTNGITVDASAASGEWVFTATGTDTAPTIATLTGRYLPPGGAGAFERSITLTIQPGETVTVSGRQGPPPTPSKTAAAPG